MTELASSSPTGATESDPTPLVEGVDVAKRFGRRYALAGLSFSVAQGEIVGLAGPNGSGKTTLLKLVAGMSRPTRGRVHVFGLDPHARREDVMRSARFAFAPPPLYDTLRAREHLRHLAQLGGSRVSRAEIDDALELVGLAERARDRVRTFSFGMRQRLILAQTLLPSPRLVVLDEPADGLDPLAVLELRAILGRLREERGVTIVLSSHLLLELDQLVDRLIVLDRGNEIFQGPPGELRGDADTIRVRTSHPEDAARLLEGADVGVNSVGERDLLLTSPAPGLSEVRELLAAGGVELLEYAVERPSLEAALIRRLREGTR